MAKTKKSSPRQVNFADAVKYLMQITDERSDQKFLENSKQITGPLSVLKSRLEVLEDLIMEKWGETDASLYERMLLLVEKQQGFQPIDEPAKLGSIVRIKIKEEKVGAESPTTPMEDAFAVVGQMQIHKDVDQLLLGMKAGDTKDVIVSNPKDAAQQVRLTVFLTKVFKGREVPNEEVKPEAAPESTPSTPQNQANG